MGNQEAIPRGCGVTHPEVVHSRQPAPEVVVAPAARLRQPPRRDAADHRDDPQVGGGAAEADDPEGGHQSSELFHVFVIVCDRTYVLFWVV
jgi:hypothetical protein